MSGISLFYLVSVAEQAGLKLTLSEISKTGFVASQPILFAIRCRLVFNYIYGP